MSVAFSRSIRSITESGFRAGIIAILLVAVMLGSWTVWALRGRVSVYEVSETARLEVEYAAHPIEASVGGRVIANHLAIGQLVHAGQVLVELDADAERLQLQEEQTQPAALDAQAESLKHEIETESQALAEARATGSKTIDEAGAQLREAVATEQFARTEAERLATLRKDGLISDLDYLRAKSKADEQVAVVDRMRIAIGRLEREHRAAELDRQTRIERLKGELTKAEAQMTTGKAAIKRTEHQLELRSVQAPISGRIGEVADLRIGAVVNGGARLGTIIPEGGIKAVAYFPPQAAMGRIRPGQPATLRLDGFPWTQYGTIAATVTTVAAEAQSGHVRVELMVRADRASAIPLQHGLPGTVEIEVKRVSPFALMMQFAETSLEAK